MPSTKPDCQLTAETAPLVTASRIRPEVRWSPAFGQAVKLRPPARRTDPDDGEAEAVHGGVQGEGGAGGAAGRADDGAAGGQARHPPDHGGRVEAAGHGGPRLGVLRQGGGGRGGAVGRAGEAARQDRPAGGGTGFFGQSLRSMMSVERRRQMIEPDHPRLSITRQCELASVSRSGFYHRPDRKSVV